MFTSERTAGAQKLAFLRRLNSPHFGCECALVGQQIEKSRPEARSFTHGENLNEHSHNGGSTTPVTQRRGA